MSHFPTIIGGGALSFITYHFHYFQQINYLTIILDEL